MMRIPIVLPATAALPKPVRMRMSPIHDAVATKFWNVAVPEMRRMPPIAAEVEPQVAPVNGSRPAARVRWIQLIQDAAAAADRRADGCPGHAHLGKRPDAEDEARAEHDVDRVGEPEHAHGDRRVARAAEHGVDEEQQQDGAAAAQHHRVKRAAGPDHVVTGAHEREQPGPEERLRSCRRPRRPPGRAMIDCTAARAAPSGSFSPIRRATVAAAPIDSPIATA